MNKKIREILIDNPDLPIMYFVSDGTYLEFSCPLVEPSRVEIEEVVSYKETIYMNKEDFEEAVYYDLETDYESEEELNKAVDEISSNTDFVKTIVIYLQ